MPGRFLFSDFPDANPGQQEQILPIRNRTPESKPAMLSVYDGQQCQGFVLARGKDGFEAFNFNGQSIGKFKTQQEATRAIPRRTRESAR
jgi:hypothetical protein